MSDSSVTHPDLGLTGDWGPGDEYAAKMNANWRRLDSLVQGAVEDKDLTAPPGSPADGDRYIVGASATGAWATHDGEIAVYDGAAWVFYAPKEGWLLWVSDEDVPYVFDGSDWIALETGGGGGGGTKFNHIAPAAFSGTGSVGVLGTGNSTIQCYHLGQDEVAVGVWLVPDDFTSLDAVRVFYANEGTDAGDMKFHIGWEVLADGNDATQDPTYWGSMVTVSPPTTAEQIDVANVTGLSLPWSPTFTPSPGDVVRVLIGRPTGFGLDNNPDDMAILGFKIEYTA